MFVCLPPFTICSWVEQFTRLLCCVHYTLKRLQLSEQGVKGADLVQQHPVSRHRGAEERLHTSVVKLNNCRWSWVIDINPAVLIFSTLMSTDGPAKVSMFCCSPGRCPLIPLCSSPQSIFRAGSHWFSLSVWRRIIFERSTSALQGNITYDWEAQKLTPRPPKCHPTDSYVESDSLSIDAGFCSEPIRHAGDGDCTVCVGKQLAEQLSRGNHSCMDILINSKGKGSGNLNWKYLSFSSSIVRILSCRTGQKIFADTAEDVFSQIFFQMIPWIQFDPAAPRHWNMSPLPSWYP